MRSSTVIIVIRPATHSIPRTIPLSKSCNRNRKATGAGLEQSFPETLIQLLSLPPYLVPSSNPQSTRRCQTTAGARSTSHTRIVTVKIYCETLRAQEHLHYNPRLPWLATTSCGSAVCPQPWNTRASFNLSERKGLYRDSSCLQSSV